ncbi:MAG: hypothetical protein QJR13_03315 [Bacillota bacterium]|nr:hypothetical protein [Bacillota bacterium]
MPLGNWKVSAVAASFLVALLLLLAGEQVFYRWEVQRPLLASLRALPGIEGAALARSGEEVLLRVRLGKAIDLPATYQALTAASRRFLKDERFALQLQDTRTPYLQETLRLMQYGIQEGIATGRFREMASTLEGLALQRRLEHYRLDVDAENVYLALGKEGHYLYAVFPRRQGSLSSSPSSGGTEREAEVGQVEAEGR